jgi:hypothetical protein
MLKIVLEQKNQIIKKFSELAVFSTLSLLKSYGTLLLKYSA